jgi:hypothetical protein
MLTYLAFRLGWNLADRDKAEPGTVWLMAGFGLLLDVFLLVILIACVR